MNCKDFDEIASLYMDEMLSDQERIDFEAHLENCEECQMKLKNLQMIVESIKETEEIELPENFTASLREKLMKEVTEVLPAAAHPVKRRSGYWKPLVAVAAGLVVVVSSSLMAGLGTMNKNKSSAPQEMAYEYDRQDSGGGVAGYGVAPAPASRPEEAIEPQSPMADTRSSLTLEGADSATDERVAIQFSDSILNEEQEASTEKKLIQRGTLRLETEDFDGAYEHVLELVDGSSGYVENSQSYNYTTKRNNPEESLKTVNMVIRVPNTDFRTVFDAIKGLGLVVEEQTGVEDVTTVYRDLENEMTNLQVQETRLREILEQAQNVEEILKVENELNRVRTRINSIQGTLKNYDRQVSLSTISVQITQVEKVDLKIKTTNVGLWDRAVNSLISSINQLIYQAEQLFIGFFGLLPALVLFGIPALILAFWIRKQLKLRRKQS